LALDKIRFLLLLELAYSTLGTVISYSPAAGAGGWRSGRINAQT
jgi:hypothetical protein